MFEQFSGVFLSYEYQKRGKAEKKLQDRSSVADPELCQDNCFQDPLEKQIIEKISFCTFTYVLLCILQKILIQTFAVT